MFLGALRAARQMRSESSGQQQVIACPYEPTAYSGPTGISARVGYSCTRLTDVGMFAAECCCQPPVVLTALESRRCRCRHPNFETFLLVQSFYCNGNCCCPLPVASHSPNCQTPWLITCVDLEIFEKLACRRQPFNAVESVVSPRISYDNYPLMNAFKSID